MRRLLTRLDRRPWSPTYGCFDREFWHYKTLYEFPRASFQQCLWGLALLYKTPFPENEFAGNPAALEWIRAALKFWAGIRHRDGSLDEWYRHEHSFCVTAHTAAAVRETLLLLGETLPDFQVTTNWLVQHPNCAVGNQVLAALDVVDDGAFKAKILSLQHAEGWFPEYEGADIGYSLLSLDYLARIWRRTGDRAVMVAAQRLLNFLRHFPVGGGEFSSRSTTHCFAYGVETFASAGDENARRILADVRATIDRVNPDDTYTAYFYSNSYCLAACDLPCLAEPLPRIQEPHAWFPGAGLAIVNTVNYNAVVNTRTGVWQAGTAGDAGYVVVQDGTVWASGRAPTQSAPRIERSADGLVVEIEKHFHRVDTSLPLTQHVVVFKLVTNWFLKLSALATWFAVFVKRRKIHSTVPSAILLRRRWVFGEAIQVDDQIVGAARSESLYRAQDAVGMHSPSAQFYVGPRIAERLPTHQQSFHREFP